jgi:tetratricopeptide (TPR) repeat protein
MGFIFNLSLRPFILAILLIPALWHQSNCAVTKESDPNHDLSQAHKAFRSGQYDEAISLYLKTDGADRMEAVVGASRTLTLIGKYTEAEKICRTLLKDFPDAVRIRCQLAEVLVLTGRSHEATRMLQEVINGNNGTIRSLVQYGKLLELRGRRAEAVSYFERAVDRYNDDILSDAEDIAMAAVACWKLESYHDANRLFREALQIDPENLEAQVLWGDLFLEKYNLAEAGNSYKKTLEQNQRYVPALVGMAKTVGGHEADKILTSALDINAHSTSAMEILAEIAIVDDRFDTAEGYLDKILQINPESLNAKTLQAAIAYLKDNHSTYETIRKAIERFSPGNAGLYTRVAEICGRKYRFAEAVELARQAIAMDPDFWEGYGLLGINLLRLGKEEEARPHLEYSFEKDPFNFWTLNTLKILDRLTGFETRTTDHFVVRMDRTDANILWPYLKPLLTECWDTLTAKYDFTPKSPILIEVFTEHEDFSVRTSGLPDIGPLVGVCFGNVITLDSPRAFKPPGSLNWQEILWHEFTHVITLQMTRNRMPRWLSEGISVFEEHHGRPEWGRKQDLELIKAVQENRMLDLTYLNEGFSKAKTPEDINFAYYQSSLVVDYIVERYGFESLKKLIYEYAASTEMEKIFNTVFKQSLNAFESGFLAWINDRIRSLNVYVHKGESHHPGGLYGTGVNLDSSARPSTPPDTTEELRKRIEAQPRDFLAHLRLGALLHEQKDHDGAVKHLTIARDLLPEYATVPNPRLILSKIYEERGEVDAMLRELDELIKYQQHAFEVCFKLAQAAHKRNDYDRAAYYLERAVAVNPYHLDTHKILAKIAMKQRDYKKAIREYKVLLALDVTDPVTAHTDLAEAFVRAGKRTDAKESALAALEIAPTYERAQTILLESLEP